MQAMQNLGGRRSKSSNSSASTAGQSSGSGSSGHHVVSADSEKRSRELRDFQTSIPENKCCFDCGQRGPTYVDLTAGSFVCTKCSGTLRGINPPHRIKSLSMSSFSAEEVAFMRSRGNVWAAKVYLGLYDHRNAASDTSTEERVKEFIIEKYEKKRYYVDPSTINYTPPSPASESSSGIIPSSSDQHLNGRTTNLIGATLNATLSARAANAAKSGGISISRPPVTAHTAPTNGATTNRSSTSSSNSHQLLAELSAPAPPVVSADPFGAGSTFGRSATFGSTSSAGSNTSALSGFGAATSFGASGSTPAGTQSAHPTASFANFDAAAFDASPFGNPISPVLLSASNNSVSNNISNAPKLPPPPGFTPPVFTESKSPLVVKCSGIPVPVSAKSRALPMPLAPIKAGKDGSSTYYNDLAEVFNAAKNSADKRFSAVLSPRYDPEVLEKQCNTVATNDARPESHVFKRIGQFRNEKLKITTKVYAQSPAKPSNLRLPVPVFKDRGGAKALPAQKKNANLKQNPLTVSNKPIIHKTQDPIDRSDLTSQRLHVTFVNDLPTVERDTKAQNLAPKHQNPSLPNISKFLLSQTSESPEDSLPVSMNCLNPFSPNYCPTIANSPRVKTQIDTFSFSSQRNPYRLGEDFFNSLFADNPINEFAVSNLPEPLPIQSRQSRPDTGLLTAQKSSAVPSGSSSGSSAAPQKQMVMSQGDRYAALKDLDDIFRTSVSVHDALPPQHSTGANLFGSPPAPPQPSHAAAPQQSSASVFGSSVPTDYPQWAAPNAPSAASPSAGAEWAWQDRNGARNSNGVRSPPVNPFTGAANLAQLNTSPWPTTGNSPINTGGHQYNASSNFAGWPPQGASNLAPTGHPNKDPFASISMQSENNNDLFAKAPKPFSTMDSNASPDNNNGFSSDFFSASKPDNSASNPFQAFFETISAPVSQGQQVGNGNPWQSTASGLAPSTNHKNPFL